MIQLTLSENYLRGQGFIEEWKILLITYCNLSIGSFHTDCSLSNFVKEDFINHLNLSTMPFAQGAATSTMFDLILCDKFIKFLRGEGCASISYKLGGIAKYRKHLAHYTNRLFRCC